MRSELEALHDEQAKLDSFIDYMTAHLSSTTEQAAKMVSFLYSPLLLSLVLIATSTTLQGKDGGLAFVTHDDIRNLVHYNNKTVMAIKAPCGTTLEVPDPDEGMEDGDRRYQIFMQSKTGPIDVFLVSSKMQGNSTAESDAAPFNISGEVEQMERILEADTIHTADAGLLKISPLKVRLCLLLSAIRYPAAYQFESAG